MRGPQLIASNTVYPKKFARSSTRACTQRDDRLDPLRQWSRGNSSIRESIT
jgi:hypothetical protein